MKLSSSQKQRIKKIAGENGVIFAVVYGSGVKGQKRPESDFDIAVLTKKPPTPKIFYTLFSQFSDAFKGENLDLRFLNDADPLFQFEVIKDGKLIYGNKQKYNQFKVYALKIYIDDGRKYFPHLDQLLEKSQQALERSLCD